MSVEVLNESGVEVDEHAIALLADYVLREMNIHPLAELSVLLVDVPHMESLHERWMGEAGPTDVLAFPMDELAASRSPYDNDDEQPEPTLLGDVVLCPQVADRQGRGAGHSMQEELELLCAHGVLHLLGFDHADPATEHEMFTTQTRLLDSWRVARGAPGVTQ